MKNKTLSKASCKFRFLNRAVPIILMSFQVEINLIIQTSSSEISKIQYNLKELHFSNFVCTYVEVKVLSFHRFFVNDEKPLDEHLFYS